MTTKLTDNLTDTENSTWKKIRSDLREDIAAAFALFAGHEDAVELGRVIGLNKVSRHALIKEIISAKPLPDPRWLLIQIERLKLVTAVPEEAFAIYDLFLSNYTHQWETKTAALVASAIKIAEAELPVAIQAEEKLFAAVNLARQETPIAKGILRVIDKLKAAASFFDRSLKPPQQNFLPPPHILELRELFADEIARRAAALAEIASEKKLPA
jgi:hypothetical protein